MAAAGLTFVAHSLTSLAMLPAVHQSFPLAMSCAVSAGFAGCSGALRLSCMTMQESKAREEHLWQQLADQGAALAGSQKLREQLTQQVSSLEQDLTGAQTAQCQASQVTFLLWSWCDTTLSHVWVQCACRIITQEAECVAISRKCSALIGRSAFCHARCSVIKTAQTWFACR